MANIARIFLLIVAVVYVLIGIGLYLSHQKGLGISYLFYAGANVGIYLASLGI
jgi:preprotein translocase subunit SecG